MTFLASVWVDTNGMLVYSKTICCMAATRDPLSDKGGFTVTCSSHPASTSNAMTNRNIEKGLPRSLQLLSLLACLFYCFFVRAISILRKFPSFLTFVYLLWKDIRLFINSFLPYIKVSWNKVPLYSIDNMYSPWIFFYLAYLSHGHGVWSFLSMFAGFNMLAFYGEFL